MNLLGPVTRTFALLSLLSIGGAGATIPEIHRQIVTSHHWMSDETFAGLVAIGNVAPGPNVLVVGAIGWQLAGLAGLLAATLAIITPAAVLALAIGRMMQRYSAAAWVGDIRAALAPIALGFMLASAYVMTRAAYVAPLSLAIVAGVTGLVTATRVSPFWGILAGALVGFVGRRLALFG